MSDDNRDAAQIVDRCVDGLRECELGDDEWQAAVDTLKSLESEGIPRIIEHLDDTPYPAYTGLVAALNFNGHLGVYDLIEALTNGSERQRDHVAGVLCHIVTKDGVPIKDLVIALAHALQDSNSGVRNWSAKALSSVGPAAKPAIPALIAALEDDICYVREYSANALGELGPLATQAIPSLKKLLLDEEPGVQDAARDALDQIK